MNRPTYSRPELNPGRGQVSPRGVLTCGLCGRSAHVERAPLSHWMQSRRYGPVHCRCLKRWRRSEARRRRLES